jgi:hypothetical protein
LALSIQVSCYQSRDTSVRLRARNRRGLNDVLPGVQKTLALVLIYVPIDIQPVSLEPVRDRKSVGRCSTRRPPAPGPPIICPTRTQQRHAQDPFAAQGDAGARAAARPSHAPIEVEPRKSIFRSVESQLATALSHTLSFHTHTHTHTHSLSLCRFTMALVRLQEHTHILFIVSFSNFVCGEEIRRHISFFLSFPHAFYRCCV